MFPYLIFLYVVELESVLKTPQLLAHLLNEKQLKTMWKKIHVNGNNLTGEPLANKV